MRRLLLLPATTCSALLLAGCGATDSPGDSTGSSAGSSAGPSSGSSEGSASSGQRFPDVEEAELTRESDGSFTAEVTISSPYDTPDRYADGWRVLDEDQQVLGTHELVHDHASEQPFTRTQSDLDIPDGVDEVTIEGRDQDNGYGGDTVSVTVPGR